MSSFILSMLLMRLFLLALTQLLFSLSFLFPHHLTHRLLTSHHFSSFIPFFHSLASFTLTSGYHGDTLTYVWLPRSRRWEMQMEVIRESTLHLEVRLSEIPAPADILLSVVLFCCYVVFFFSSAIWRFTCLFMIDRVREPKPTNKYRSSATFFGHNRPYAVTQYNDDHWIDDLRVEMRSIQAITFLRKP